MHKYSQSSHHIKYSSQIVFCDLQRNSNHARAGSAATVAVSYWRGRPNGSEADRHHTGQGNVLPVLTLFYIFTTISFYLQVEHLILMISENCNMSQNSTIHNHDMVNIIGVCGHGCHLHVIVRTVAIVNMISQKRWDHPPAPWVQNVYNLFKKPSIFWCDVTCIA